NSYSLSGVRALFASTGVKGEDLEPEYYIKELYHPYAVNTAPLTALNAFMELGDVEEAYLPDMDELEEFFANVKEAGVDLNKVSKELLEQGLEDFKVAFGKILASLE
ncbi:MAG: transaldolase, partial [Helicobacter sp.]|nr:transaldolase [Helicobacter sp.]